MEVADGTIFTVKLTAEQLKLIQYWRESCHHYNEFCPLHCLKGGTDFCHEVIKHLSAQVQEQKGA